MTKTLQTRNSIKNEPSKLLTIKTIAEATDTTEYK